MNRILGRILTTAVRLLVLLAAIMVLAYWVQEIHK